MIYHVRVIALTLYDLEHQKSLVSKVRGKRRSYTHQLCVLWFRDQSVVQVLVKVTELSAKGEGVVGRKSCGCQFGTLCIRE